MGYSYIQGELTVVVPENRAADIKDEYLLDTINEKVGNDSLTYLIDYVGFKSTRNDEGDFVLDSTMLSFSQESSLCAIQEKIPALVHLMVAEYEATINGRLYITGEGPLDVFQLSVVNNAVNLEQG